MIKKRLKLKEKYKFRLMLILWIIIGIALTQLYIKRIEEINSPDFVIISNLERDK